MKRETVNRLRFVLEDVLPPLVRDSFLFRWMASLAWGKHISNLASFRRRGAYVSDEEYEAIYRAHPQVHEDSDCSAACIEAILGHVAGESVCDVGCGGGFLIRRIRDASPVPYKRLAGVDFVLPGGGDWNGIETHIAKIEHLPFPEGAFDTVVCTHVLEHIYDVRAAVSELRRICRKRLIIVVPREREYRYSFNAHFHFFPYLESFLRVMLPLAAQHQCTSIGRDIFYVEDRP